jgi:hypothetical protein
MVGLTTGLLPLVSLQTVLQTCNTSRNISDSKTQHRSKSPIIHTLVLQTLERITGNLKRSSSDREEIEELRDQLAKSENRGKALEGHLEECKDKIFSMQPQQIVPDTTIMAMYNSFGVNIDT